MTVRYTSIHCALGRRHARRDDPRDKSFATAKSREALEGWMGGQVSLLLVRWSEGDRAALDQLMALVYQELRNLGRAHLAKHSQQGMLQPTVLVHEAWLKLANKDQILVSSRLQFFALSAKIMRDILVDHFRKQRALKRGGSLIEVPLENAPGSGADFRTDILDLEDALRRLAAIKPRYAKIVELKFFGGLTIDESAEVLQISHATIEREWNLARSWLQRELSRP